MTSRVFVVQRPAVRDRATGEWISKYDLTPAETFGELVDVLPIGPTTWNPAAMTAQAERVLQDFDDMQDHILAVGDPVAIAAVAMIAGRFTEHGGGVSILKWDKRDQRYQSFRVRVP